MNFISTPLAGCGLIEPARYHDSRGYFQEAFHQQRYQQLLGKDTVFVQDNFSHSVKGVLRGMHFQHKQPQGKLISVLQGEIFDVVVDIRPDSATFGQWHGVTLSAVNGLQLWVPAGFAHGFQVLSDTADVFYKCTCFYNPADEGAFNCLDAKLAINWPLSEKILSVKDAAALAFQQAMTSVFDTSTVHGRDSAGSR